MPANQTSPKRIIHCTNFNYVKRGGCYMNMAPYKISNGLIRNGHQVLDKLEQDAPQTVECSKDEKQAQPLTDKAA